MQIYENPFKSRKSLNFLCCCNDFSNLIIFFSDEKVNFAVQKGLDASRSEVIFFKHNDMNDLERLLQEQDKKDKKNPKKSMKSKHFLVAEGIYMNTGEMCPLKELIKLRQTYKLRFFLDESLTFGTLGANGRGLTEHFNVDVSQIFFLKIIFF